MAQFRHIGIVVKNIDKSIKFYQKYFNFKIEIEMNEGGKYLDSLWNTKNSKIKTVKLSDKTNGICLELLEIINVNGLSKRKKSLKIHDLGITHFALTVNDLEKIYLNMKKNKVQFLGKPVVTIDKKAKVVFCKDPDGCFIELVQVII